MCDKNINACLTNLNNVDWNTTLTNTDVSVLFDWFYEKLLAVINKHIPLKKITVTRHKLLNNPWISPGL